MFVETARPVGRWTTEDELIEAVEDPLDILTNVMAEYDCDSTADAVHTAATIALERDEADLARQLAGLLQE